MFKRDHLESCGKTGGNWQKGDALVKSINHSSQLFIKVRGRLDFRASVGHFTRIRTTSLEFEHGSQFKGLLCGR